MYVFPLSVAVAVALAVAVSSPYAVGLSIVTQRYSHGRFTSILFLQNIISFIGLFCKRDLEFDRFY